MDYEDTAPALEVIWDHDRVILEQGLSFYKILNNNLDQKMECWQKILTKIKHQKASNQTLAGSIGRTRRISVGSRFARDRCEVITGIGFDDLSVVKTLRSAFLF